MATENYNTALNTQDYTTPAQATPTGLINTQATTQAPAATYTGAQTTAAEWDVKPNQTVQSQVKSIIDENSPLMQQAETRALQGANKRGLMNSSIAVGAGQAALYDVATPIAAADASTFARAGEFNAGAQQQVNLANQGSTNTAEQFNAASTNQVNSQNSQLTTNVALNNASLNTDLAKFNASQSNELTKLGMDAQTKTELANIEASYKMLMQSNASAADLYKQMMQGTMTIMTNKDMDAATKATAIKNQIAQLNSGLGIIGQIGNLNLEGLLTFNVPGAGGGSADGTPTSYLPGESGDPVWENILSNFNAEHMAKYGVPMNRPWSSDAQSQETYQSLLQQYQAAKG